MPAWRRRLEAAEHALAEAQAVQKPGRNRAQRRNDRLNELERDLDEARAAGTLPAAPGMRPGRFLVSHLPRILVERGRSGAATTEHEQHLHSEAALHHAIRRASGLTAAATQTLQHRPTSTAERLRARGEGRHYSTFSLYPPQELRAAIAPSWPACRP